MRIPNVSVLRENKYNSNIKDNSYESMNVTKSIPDEIYNPVQTTEFSIDNDKDKIKFIKLCERFVRSSFEYSELRDFLLKEMDMTQCAYLEGITVVDNRRMKVEIHHSPFTLYDITEIVINKHNVEYEGSLDLFKICEEVLEVHFRGLVGLIPLSETVHELVHNGVVFVPVNYVYGRINDFVNEYQLYIPNETLTALRKNIEISEEFIRVPDILKPKYVYMESGYSLPKADIFHKQHPGDEIA
ncbi:MAG: hypothetical protein ACRCXT_00765 [Paraclostridium sp.]